MRFRRAPAPEEPRGPTPPLPAIAAYAPPARTAPLPGEIRLTPEDEQRADDMALLRALVAHLGSAVEALDESIPPAVDPEDEQEIDRVESDVRGRAEEELEAFASMLSQLGRTATLSPKQRSWAVQAAERYDISWGDPGARNRAVPRGAEVRLLIESMPRPLAPPGRRKAP